MIGMIVHISEDLIMGISKLTLALMAVIAVAGCTRNTDALRVNTQGSPQPLPSSPSGTVETTRLDQLPAIGGPGATYDQQNGTLDPNAPQNPQDPNAPNFQVASTDGEPISHEAMTGGSVPGGDPLDLKRNHLRTGLVGQDTQDRVQRAYPAHRATAPAH